jgi:dihydrodipicolinate synthase/N-acetylneuraminate lyase
VTLFDDDGRLLLDETAEHARDLVERGVTAVVVSGSTGESWALSVDERLELCAAFTGDLGAQRDLLDAHREAHVDFPAGLKGRLARLRGASAAVRSRAAAATS